MHLEQKKLESQNHELGNAYREKAKQQGQLQKLYTSLKHQQVAAGLELAADDDAENVLQAATTGPYNTSTDRNGQPMQSRAGSKGSRGSGGRRQNVHPWENPAQNNRAGLQSSRE